MRDTIGWSYDLLGSDDQWRFRRLARLGGSWPMSAAVALLREDEQAAMAAVARLVERSLVTRRRGDPEAEAEFGMLETIRAFGLEQLEAAGEVGDAEAAVATWVLELARAGDDGLASADQGRWLVRREHHLLYLLRDVGGVPRSYGLPDADSLAIEYLDGRPVCDVPPPEYPRDYFDRLDALVREARRATPPALRRRIVT